MRSTTSGSRTKDTTASAAPHRGNCVARSLLYLAVTDRLGLPVKAVLAPEHMFVRWDDGTTRRNIEVTDSGIEVADAQYMTRIPRLRIRPEEVEQGLFLVPIGKREVISRLAANLSGRLCSSNQLRGTKRYRSAIEHADVAIRLDPRNDLAYLNRARALWRLDPTRVEDALSDVRAALAIRPMSYSARMAEGGLNARAGNPGQALAAFERALELAPGDLEAQLNRAACMLEMGRLEESATATESALERHPDSTRLRRIRLVAWVRLRREGWRSDLEDLVENPVATPAIHLDVAELLLRPEGDRPIDAGAALLVLDRIRAVMGKSAGSGSHVIETIGGETGTVLATAKEAVTEDQRRYLDLRLRALIELGRTEEAGAVQRRLEALSDR